jgi:glucokinase
LASESAVEANAIRILKTGAKTILQQNARVEDLSITADQIVNAAKQGDAVCKNILSAAARYLGIGFINVINMVNPDIIIINNDTLISYGPFLEEIRRIVNNGAYSREIGTPEIAISSLGEDAVCIGAASVVMDRILADNEVL